MPSNPRVFALLEEMLESGRAAEEVCADCPELLPEVQRRWQSFRLIDEEVAALLPDSATHRDPDGVRPLGNTGELPQIPGTAWTAFSVPAAWASSTAPGTSG